MQVNLESQRQITDCYMFVWKLFYAEYLLIPFLLWDKLDWVWCLEHALALIQILPLFDMSKGKARSMVAKSRGNFFVGRLAALKNRIVRILFDCL